MEMKSLSHILFILIIFSCSRDSEHKTSDNRHQISDTIPIAIVNQKLNHKKTDTCELERKFIAHGLVDIMTIIPDLKIDLRYSTSNNFMKMDLYGDLEKIYILPNVAQKLKFAQSILKKQDSTLSLLIFDCVRPLSVQKQMWDTVKMPVYKKIKFLSNPAFGSLHNYGAAVDLSICTINGKELDMGTEYDDTATLAYPTMENFYLANGKLTKEQVNNRKLLRNLMYKAGFFGIQTEWWHFNSCIREYAQSMYKIIN